MHVAVTAVASLRQARFYHTATLLANGRVLVAGGRQAALLASAEVYTPETNTWSDAGALSLARCYYTATLLPNGEVLVAGGSSTVGTTPLSAVAHAARRHSRDQTWRPGPGTERIAGASGR